MGSHKTCTVTQTGRNIRRTEWRLNLNTVIAISYAWIVRCIELFGNIKLHVLHCSFVIVDASLCQLHELKLTSAASQKFIP